MYILTFQVSFYLEITNLKSIFHCKWIFYTLTINPGYAMVLYTIYNMYIGMYVDMFQLLYIYIDDER